jgi:hypothetical protein
VGKAAGPKVDDLDGVLVGVLQQDVLRLQVAVDDVVLVQKGERLQDLDAKAPDAVHAESLVVVVLDRLVQVDGQQTEADAQVVAEVKVVDQVDDVGVVLRILRPPLSAQRCRSSGSARART